MSKRYLEHEAWDDDDDGDFDEHAYDEDQPDDDWEPDEDDDATDPCPHCGASVYHDAEQCPRCGAYLSREDAPSAAKPLWIVLTVLVLLGLFAIAALR